MTLRKAGFVKSFRGTNGGYALAKAPADITVHDILTALEGPVEVLREQVPRGASTFTGPASKRPSRPSSNRPSKTWSPSVIP